MQWIDESFQLCMCACLGKQLYLRACTFVFMHVCFYMLIFSDGHKNTSSLPVYVKVFLCSLFGGASPQLGKHCSDPAACTEVIFFVQTYKNSVPLTQPASAHTSQNWWVHQCPLGSADRSCSFSLTVFLTSCLFLTSCSVRHY